MEFLEWIENDLHSQEQHFLAVQEKNLSHEEKVNDVTADHSNPPTPQEKKHMQLSRSIPSWHGTTGSFTKCQLSIAKERRSP